MLNKVLKEQKEEDLHIIKSDSQGKEENQLFNEKAKINPFDLLIGDDQWRIQEIMFHPWFFQTFRRTLGVQPKGLTSSSKGSHQQLQWVSKVVSMASKGSCDPIDPTVDPPLATTPKTTSYGLLFIFGQVRDFFRKIIDWWSASNLQDCFNRPIASAPDAWFDVVERYSNDYNKTLKLTKKTSRCLNLGSYNYLGFAASDEYCTPRAVETLKKYSPST
ncbi:hypothetical protein DVH24_014859 [Malus domestica]|uniref:Aminotransferase class I/classII domain-containing protein n=1 Tax=Malus domestica TaxID=3750 RepID=A0A498K034_MALDO|nr:hypothetical protein DVH24_014859 [Malus domestica]